MNFTEVLNVNIIKKISLQIDETLQKYIDSRMLEKIKNFIKSSGDFNEIEVCYLPLNNNDIEIYQTNVLLVNLSNKVANFLSKLIEVA